MKKIISTISLVFCLTLSLSAHNGFVILTEEYNNVAPYVATVHVFWADGTVTSKTITHAYSNLVSQLDLL